MINKCINAIRCGKGIQFMYDNAHNMKKYELRRVCIEFMCMLEDMTVRYGVTADYSDYIEVCNKVANEIHDYCFDKKKKIQRHAVGRVYKLA